LALEEFARPAFDDEDIRHLRALVSVTVDFYDYLTSTPPWPQFPGGPFEDMRYVVDTLFIHIDSFRTVMRLYGVLVGAQQSTVDWRMVDVASFKEQFTSLYRAFVDATGFEIKCRLLLDLVKLQIVFAGASYDCLP